MQDLIDQIEGAIGGRAYYLALYASLTVPDMCGAMESDDGMATRSKYIAWFDKYVAPGYFAAGVPTPHGRSVLLLSMRSFASGPCATSKNGVQSNTLC